MTTTTLSPEQAATRAGCSRSSIRRALASGELRAIRDNIGCWRIEGATLDDWASLRRPPGHQRPTTATTSPEATTEAGETTSLRAERDGARIEVAGLRVEVAQLRERLDEARADRDRWHTIAVTPRPGVLARLVAAIRPMRA